MGAMDVAQRYFDIWNHRDAYEVALRAARSSDDRATVCHWAVSNRHQRFRGDAQADGPEVFSITVIQVRSDEGEGQLSCPRWAPSPRHTGAASIQHQNCMPKAPECRH
jgi:hypothetical protein